MLDDILEKMRIDGEYKQGLELIEEKLDQTTNEDKFTILIFKTRFLIETGEYITALRISEQLLDIIENNNELESYLGIIYELKASIYRRLGEFNQAIENCNHAINFAKKYDNNSYIINALNSKSITLHILGENEIAEQISKEVLELARETGYDEGQAVALNTLGMIFSGKGELDKATVNFEKSLEIHMRNGFQSGIAEALNNLGNLNESRGNIDLALEYFNKALMIYEKNSNPSGIATTLNIIGITNHKLGQFEQALVYYNKSLKINDKIGNQAGVAASYNNIGNIYHNNGELDLALNYYLLALKLFEQGNTLKRMASALNNIGIIYSDRGELEEALNYYNKSLEININIDNQSGIAGSLTNIGNIYAIKGDDDLALEYFVRSLEIYERIDNKTDIALSLRNIIDVSSDDQIPPLLEKLEILYKENENNLWIELQWKFTKALYLKKQKRSRAKVEAEKLLLYIIDNLNLQIDSTMEVIKHYIELLIIEYQHYQDQEVMDEINEKIEKMINFAKSNNSHSSLVESQLLKGQLFILNNEFIEAKKILSQAQITSEERGFKRLAVAISNEFDKLLKLEFELNEKNISKGLDNKLNSVQNTLQKMQRRKLDQVDEINEDPVLFLIMSQSGSNLYSKSFSDKYTPDENMIAIFLKAIDSFNKQVLSTDKPLNRIVQGDYKIVLEVVDNLTYCYVFKGPSYKALKKMQIIADRITSEINFREMAGTIIVINQEQIHKMDAILMSEI
ncbi:MAG: tetratricopeptide repeat protein [Candidatus Heimdallarchaeota archaeon]|nr:tetratricopeptide repeat protein [Candidatus Heimdallarchaeota archaeon]